MSLPRAALAQNWDVQAFGALLPPDAAGKRSVSALSRLFSADDFVLIRRAVLDACDGDDGLADGIISRYRQCGGVKLQKALENVQCAAGAKDPMMHGWPDQFAALLR